MLERFRHGISPRWLTITRRVMTALAAIAMLAALTVRAAPPAAAQASGIYGVTGHLEVSRFFGATNTYKLYAHLAVGVTHLSNGNHDYQARVHFHNQVNGASFSGARVNVNVCLQYWGSGIGWQTQASSCLQHNYVAGAWFADSDTLLGQTKPNSSQPPVEVRAIIIETKNTRFLHKNDSGTELVDMDQEVSLNAATA
jgi:hypothetical protein